MRLLVDREGRMDISDEAIAKADGETLKAARVCIWQERTDANDTMLFHKTTHRPLYARALKSRWTRGLTMCCSSNHAGEVTEGAISNVFTEKAGRWQTPPVECGLLAGVYRRHLLETLSGVEERVLHRADLQRADAVYLCNAVRGVRRVEIDWSF